MEQVRSIVIPVGIEELEGELVLPPHPRGLVIFAQGSGSSRLDMRNRAVAELLREHGLATLLFDLISPGETLEDDISGSLRFDVEWLARRLVAATDWLVRQPEAATCRWPTFGENTGFQRRPHRRGGAAAAGARAGLARRASRPGGGLPAGRAGADAVHRGPDRPRLHPAQRGGAVHDTRARRAGGGRGRGGTCSRSAARSRRWPSWPRAGWAATSRAAQDRPIDPVP
jgi:hypothetical protein